VSDGDSLLDTPEVRNALKTVWTQSGAERDTIVANHAEYMYGIYRNPDASLFVDAVSGTGFPCGIDPQQIIVPLTLGTAVLIGTIHPHPFKWGQVYPASCGGMAGQQYHTSNAQQWNGRASDEDWKTSKTLSAAAGRSVPGFIIDYDGIYKYDGSVAQLNDVLGFIIVTNGFRPEVYEHWPRYDPQRMCSRP